jgi:hypothetical protein
MSMAVKLLLARQLISFLIIYYQVPTAFARTLSSNCNYLQDISSEDKGKGHPPLRGPRRTTGVSGTITPDLFTFGTTKVVGRQPHAPAAFTPRRIPWYSFLETESTPGHMVPSVAAEKKSPV